MSPRIFFIGDSFTHGTGDPACLGWVGRVCAQAMTQGPTFRGTPTCYNLGIRGDTSQLIQQRWQQEVHCRLAETAGTGLVFCFGANDVDLDEDTGQPRVNPVDSLAYAEAILRKAQKLGSILMIESPPIADDPEANDRLELLNGQLEKLCNSLNIAYVQTCQALLQNSAWMEEAIANDGAHPNAKGYKALAQIVLQSAQWQQWLQQLGESGL